MMMHYILDENHNPIKVDDFVEWCHKYREFQRVALDEIDNVTISTVFLGMDHSHGGEIPVLFETMTFSSDPDYSEYQWRYCTYDEAVKGHNHICDKIRNKIPLNDRKTIKIDFKCGDL